MLQVLRLFFDLRGAPDQGDPLQRHPRPVLRHRHARARSTRRSTSSSGIEGTPGPAGSSAEAEQGRCTPEQPPDHTKPTAGAPRSKSSGVGALEPRLDPTRPTASSSREASGARKEKVPVYYPTVLETGQRLRAEAPRLQDQRQGRRSRPHTTSAPPTSGSSRCPTLGDYYGFEGTRWKDPPILDNPTRREDDRRARLQALLRRRPAADGRLADRPGLVLGLELLIETRPERGHAQDRRGLPRSSRGPEPRRGEPEREREGADRGRRSRLGRAGHRRLLRRAGPPRGGPRDRPGEGRGARSRARSRSTSRACPS